MTKEFTASGASAGGAGLIFPNFAVLGTANLLIKTTNSTTSTANVAAFWTVLQASHTAKGFECVVLDAVADTSKQTIVDVSVPGVLTNIICPELTSAGTVTVEVIIDGVTTIITSETLAAGDRFCIGGFTNIEATASATSPTGLASRLDFGFNATRNSSTILDPTKCVTAGIMIGVVAKTSIEVNVQGSVAFVNTAEKKKACANYLTSIPIGL